MAVSVVEWAGRQWSRHPCFDLCASREHAPAQSGVGASLPRPLLSAFGRELSFLHPPRAM